eukprot:m.347573 g.347573  ORF g.347573 m.347573 type:complete len:1593 (+) comp27925_c0_seq4:270-5048(+)
MNGVTISLSGDDRPRKEKRTAGAAIGDVGVTVTCFPSTAGRSSSSRNGRPGIGSRSLPRRASSDPIGLPLSRIFESDLRQSLGQNRRASSNLDHLRRSMSSGASRRSQPIPNRRKTSRPTARDSAQLSTSSALEAIRAASTAPQTKLPPLKSPGGGPPSRDQSPELIDWLLEREAVRLTKPKLAALAVQCPPTATGGQRRPSRPIRDLHWRPESSPESIAGNVARTVGGPAVKIDPDHGMASMFPLFGLASNPEAEIIIQKLLLHSRAGVFQPKHAGDAIPDDLKEKLSKDQMAYVMRIGGGFVVLADGTLLMNSERVLADGRQIHADGTIYDATGNLIGNSRDEVVLADGTRVLADGSRVLADGTRVLADGSKVLSDGTKLLSDGTKVLADGTRVLADGTKVLADGSRVLSDGTKISPDGSKILADGTQVLADGSTILPDGTKVLADGTKVLADGTKVLADGTKILADGSKIFADGTKVLGDSTANLNDERSQKRAEEDLVRDLKVWVVDRHCGTMSTEVSESFFEAHPQHRASFQKFESKSVKAWGKVKKAVVKSKGLAGVVEAAMARDAALKRLTLAHPDIFGFEDHPDTVAAQRDVTESETVFAELKAKMEALEHDLSRIVTNNGASTCPQSPAAQAEIADSTAAVEEAAAQVVALRTHVAAESVPQIKAAMEAETTAVETTLQLKKEIAQLLAQPQTTQFVTRMAAATKKLALAERAFAKSRVNTMKARLASVPEGNSALQSALSSELEAAEIALDVHDRLVALESEMEGVSVVGNSLGTSTTSAHRAQVERSVAEAEQSFAKANSVLIVRSIAALRARIANDPASQPPEVKVALARQLEVAELTVTARDRAEELRQQLRQSGDASMKTLLNKSLAHAQEQIAVSLVDILKVRMLELHESGTHQVGKVKDALAKELAAAIRLHNIRSRVCAALVAPKATHDPIATAALDTELVQAEEALARTQVETLQARVSAEIGSPQATAAATHELDAAKQVLETRCSGQIGMNTVAAALADNQRAEVEQACAKTQVDALRAWVASSSLVVQDDKLVTAVKSELDAAEQALKVRQRAVQLQPILEEPDVHDVVRTELVQAETTLARSTVVTLQVRLGAQSNKSSEFFSSLSKELKAAEHMLQVRERIHKDLTTLGGPGSGGGGGGGDAGFSAEVGGAVQALADCRIETLRMSTAALEEVEKDSKLKACRAKELEALIAMTALNREQSQNESESSPRSAGAKAKSPSEKEAARAVLVKELMAADTKMTAAQASLPSKEKASRMPPLRRRPLFTAQGGGQQAHARPRVEGTSAIAVPPAQQEELKRVKAQFEQAGAALTHKKKALASAPKTGMLTVGKKSLRKMGQEGGSGKKRRGLRKDLPKGGQTKRKGDDDAFLLSAGFQGTSALDYLSQFCILSDAQLAKYHKVFDHVDTDMDGKLSMDELKFGIRTVNSNMISNKEVTYVDAVLDLRLVKDVNFRMFSVIAALSERVVGLDRMVRDMVNYTDFRAMETKMDACKHMFYLLDETRDGLVPMDNLMYQVRAGRISPEHEKVIIDRFSEDGKLYVDFLDFLTYLLLFLEIHETINENPFDDRRTK